MSPALASRFFTASATWEAQHQHLHSQTYKPQRLHFCPWIDLPPMILLILVTTESIFQPRNLKSYLIYSLDGCFLSTYYVPGIGLNAKDTVMYKLPCPHGAAILGGCSCLHVMLVSMSLVLKTSSIWPSPLPCPSPLLLSSCSHHLSPGLFMAS